ncbi:hypothetical protein LTR35_006231 [Friedmanniomyces endolithicus]|uniref:C3H1-type domain-containing protein n=1 Tax=Friedmanniomyces endolithicus TaxID=329885 RepID=A0AAN6FSZ8_9PEZI|nr:hypothetical protein LTR35_006231 [Friedmanniomyces endolithicus]KAK0301293.1 hypothetical protein LTS00_000442 [Friedmanniomyces endolithicus]KAK0322209.1 hypothetical protein LTR82_006662 [Friedmanniomyces endolithicus]KAK1014521.1 hypothetical protein LTR54_004173 [Friedmanniomyces endolithicus]
MNGGFNPPFANGTSRPQHQSNHSLDGGAINGGRMPADRNGAMPMPVAPPQRPYSGMPSETGALAGMGMQQRSPTRNQSELVVEGTSNLGSRRLRRSADTQHVPCKFYLQGACQAGRMCPFSHDLECTTRPAPCKYFAKGGCKFGRKCALLHITPDGTIVNRMPPMSHQATPYLSMAGTYAQPPPPGLLSMQAHGLEQRPNGEGMQDFEHYQYGPRNGCDPSIDMTFTSASPTYGSPQNDRLAASPPQKGLSVLDAPLPNSFDSNGVSMAARIGPFAASVPSRFGVESPSSSLPRMAQLGNTALRDLHSSAFGDRGMDGVLANIGSSPPSGTDEPLIFSKRTLHSDRFRSTRQPMVSASLGTRLPTTSFEYSDDEDGDTDREEDLLPASLHDLIPEGRSRRESRSRVDGETPAGFLSAARRTLSGHGPSQDSKVGSLGSSPSRYTSVFGRAQPVKVDSEGFGHIGSPLRNAGFSFASGIKPTNGELSPSIASPPRQASMSMLTQELQRTKLDAARSQGQAVAGATSHPAPIRTLSNGSNGRSGLDRGMSSTNVSKIDEEQELFDMDEVGGPTKTAPRPIPNGSISFGAIGGHRSTK